MKREIEKLLKSENDTLELNSMFELRRWQKDALGNKVDNMELELKRINGVEFSKSVPIINREYMPIIQELNLKMRYILDNLEEEIVRDLICGYRRIGKEM